MTTGGSMLDSGVPTTELACERVIATRDPGEATLVTSTQSPEDFEVTRLSIGYSEDCIEPKVIIELSDGRCPDGDGHRLQFEFDATAVFDGQIPRGQIDLGTAVEARQIGVTYTRPSGLTPEGTFGTCATAEGLLGLTQQPGTARNSVYAGSYQLTLSACPGSSAPPQDVQGTFTGKLRVGLDTACP